MTVYGLDILVEEDSKGKTKLWLGEVNGIMSAIFPFRRLYGDRRVEEKVCSMLTDRYGKLEYLFRDQAEEMLGLTKKPEGPPKPVTITKKEGKFTFKGGYKEIEERIKTHPLRMDFPSVEGRDGGKLHHSQFPFERFRKESDSAILNAFPVELPLDREVVNPYFAEEITRNKILSYQLLRNTKVLDHIPRTALIGLGISDPQELEALVSKGEKFVIKPIRDCQSNGVSFVEREEVLRYGESAGEPLWSRGKKEVFTEDLLLRENLSVQRYLGIAQEFIDTTRFSSRVGGRYSVIRSIVCNGEYVDSFARVGNNPCIDCSPGVENRLVSIRGLKEFSEEVIGEFEKRLKSLGKEIPLTYLYLEYLSQQPRTPSDNLNKYLGAAK